MPVIRNYPVKRQKEDTRDYPVAFQSQVSKIPAYIDLRRSPLPIFNQSSLGSCTANAGVANLMMLEAKEKHIPVTKLPLLSRLFLYYQERVLENTINEDNGATMRSICKALNKFGVCEEKYFPYNIPRFAIAPTKEAMEDAVNHKITSYRALNSLADIKKYIATEGLPVLIGMEIYESFESPNVAKSGIVPMPLANERFLGGHAVLVVGYSDSGKNIMKRTSLLDKIIKKLRGGNIDEGFLIVRNSWGDDWGDDGYFYLPYNFVNKNHAFDFWTLG